MVVGVSIERLTHDRYKWRGEDIANINTVAQRSVIQQHQHLPAQLLQSFPTVGQHLLLPGHLFQPF